MFVFQNGKWKSKNEFWVEIRFSICETQNENRIMKRTTDRNYMFKYKATATPPSPRLARLWEFYATEH